MTNDLHIELIKGTKNSIPCINNWKNLRKKPIDLSLKNKKIAFCTQLPFEILSFSSHVDNEEINVISSDVEMNESKFLCTKSEKNSFYFKILGISNFLEFHKQLKQEGKIKSDDINEELSKHIELNKNELAYKMI